MKKTNVRILTGVLLSAALLIAMIGTFAFAALAADGDACTVTAACTGTFENGICNVCGGYEPATSTEGGYEIGNAGQLYWFAAHVNAGNTAANAKLMADIDLENRFWYPIGVYVDAINANGDKATAQYVGTFDGNNHTVSNFTAIGNGSQGLFGYCNTTQTQIKNLGVINATVSGWNAGAVAGYCANLTNCYAVGCTITGASDTNTEAVTISSVGGNNGNIVIDHCWAYDCELIVGEGETNFVMHPVGGIRASDGGVNNVQNCYYGEIVTDVAFTSTTGAVEKTKEQFASGEVAYLLGEAFGQKIGTDTYPVFVTENNKVFYNITGGCTESTYTYEYSNTEKEPNYTHAAFDKNGFCSDCGNAYEPAVYNEEKNRYEISNAGMLYWFMEYVNAGGDNAFANAVLTDDIVVNENVLRADGSLSGDAGTFRAWFPIGYWYDRNEDGESEDVRFDGTFDGQGHTVSGLYLNNEEQSIVGLFGQIKNVATVKNVGVIDSYFWAYEDVGGVVGSNAGTVQNSYSTGLIGGYRNVGGVAGYNYYGTVQNCYNTGTVSGTNSVGGVVGNNWGTVQNCYNIGSVSGSLYVGGVVGENRDTVQNCFYLSDSENDEVDGTTAVAAAQFASGEVTWLLNGGTNYVNSQNAIWRQTYGEDALPGFEGLVVYRSGSCSESVYSNVRLPLVCDFEVEGNDANGFCSCGLYQEAPRTTDKYDLDGDGVKDKVFEISNAGQLYWFAQAMGESIYQEFNNDNAVLIADIVINEDVLEEMAKDSPNADGFRVWVPIGSVDHPYNGTFDGQGHTISGLYYSDATASTVGLFGRTGTDAIVKNVGVIDSYIHAKDNVGGVVGHNGGTVENCYNTGSVSGSSYVGGVVGANNSGSVENCYNTGSVSGNIDVGGVVGANNSGSVENCYNTGSVSGNVDVGGVVGYNSEDSLVQNCYNTGSVSGNEAVGGVIGDNSSTGVVQNCYYLSDTETDEIDGTTAKTAAQFASGEVAYLLQQGVTAPEEGEEIPEIWGQTVGKDQSPTLGGDKVYLIEAGCPNLQPLYSNNENAKGGEHDFAVNGFCFCGAYQPAELNEDGYYEISNAGQLYWFMEYVNAGKQIAGEDTPDDTADDVYSNYANAILTADIVVNENVLASDGSLNAGSYREWFPIGYNHDRNGDGSPEVVLYNGTFDGRGHTVSGLYLNNTNQSYVGLFGGTNKASIKHVGVIDSYFHAGDSVGGVVGTLDAGTVENCYNEGSVSGITLVGGVVGYAYGGVRNCYNEGLVSGTSNVGGVVGYNNGIVENCYNVGTVSGSASFGGVAGGSSGVVQNCYYLDTCGAAGEGTSVTAEQFASGEVAYLLGEGFGQTLGEDGDALPVFATEDNVVYRNIIGGCTEKSYIYEYSNTDEGDEISHISYQNGFCEACDEYEPAVYNKDKGYYEISNAGMLYWFMECVNIGGEYSSINAVLTEDIMVNEGIMTDGNTGARAWTPIGNNTYSYTGTFDGQGHTVSGLSVNTSAHYQGFFGYVGTGGSVKNVGVINSYIKGGNNVGGVVGCNDGTVSDCYNAGTTVIGLEYVGGVVGDNDGNVQRCSNESDVSGEKHVGGITGFNGKGSIVANCSNEGTVSGSADGIGGVVGNNRGTVQSSYNTGGVTATGEVTTTGGYVGGVVGYNTAFGTVQSSYNTGTVSGVYYVGGVVGYNGKDVKNCYNTGSVSGARSVGGVVGYNSENSLVQNCYNTGAVSATEENGGGVIGYQGLSTVTNCYYLNDCGATGTGTSVTLDQLASGEVAYKLGEGFGQIIDTDSYPVLANGENTVYYGYAACADAEKSYANVPLPSEQAHDYKNGFCTECDAYEPAVYNEEKGYYEISNAGMLYWFMEYVNAGGDNASANAVLTADIVVNKGVLASDGSLNEGTYREWFPIGYFHDRNEDGESEGVSYAGTFDGQEHTISGLYFYNADQDNVGLFGKIDANATVKNVGVIDSYFEARDSTGGVVGQNWGTVQNCYNTGAVSGTNNVSGVVGYNYGRVENCYNTGSVSNADSVGGVVGCNDGTVENCYNEGSVSGTNYVGGVVGDNYNGTVENCYNTGAVSGTNYVGGVVGNNYGTVQNCYYLSGTAIGGIKGADAAEQAEAKTAAQFASGEVAYLLQGEQTEQIWGQTLNLNQTPVLGGAKVYAWGYSCQAGEQISYSNTEITEPAPAHVYANGFCLGCGGYESAVYNEEKGYYEISNAGQLYWFMEYVNSAQLLDDKGDDDDQNDVYTYHANAVLTADIVVNENVLAEMSKETPDVSTFRAWFPIGYFHDRNEDGESEFVYYEGTFDGQGHTVSGLYFENTAQNYVGLFGQIKNVAAVKNVGVIDSYFHAGLYVGGVVGQNWGTVQKCYNTGAVSGTNSVGGVVGYNVDTMQNCYNTGSVSGTGSYVGGVVGFNDGATVQNCYNIGVVSGTQRVGGVVGNNWGTVQNCYNEGSVSGTGSYVGGVVGNNDDGTVENCYNTGSVSGDSDVGGVVGYNYNATVENCYYLSDTETDEIDGTTAMTAAQFASGEVAYLLGEGFGQTVGTDTCPVFANGENTVYYGYKACTDTNAIYANVELYATIEAAHVFGEQSNGFCEVCDAYEPAVYNQEKGYYEISNAGMLYWFMEYVNADGDNVFANAVLTADIVVNENVLASDGSLNGDGSTFRAWFPIGYFHDRNEDGKTEDVYYHGTFDGQGHTVSGLYFNHTEQYCVGLFGQTENGATIRNVGVIDAYFQAGDYVGGVVGFNYYGTVENCYNEGSVSGTSYVGGVVGYNNGNVENCYNVGLVSGAAAVGGVAGYSNGTVENCYNTGAVSGAGYVGGVVGENCGNVKNCYYLSDPETDEIEGTTAKTAAQFASGEVAYLLGEAFGQKIGTDTYPVFATEDNKVYGGFATCVAMTKTYSNDPDALAPTQLVKHTWVYTAEGGVLTATCAHNPDHKIIYTLVALEELTFDYTEKVVTMDTEVVGEYLNLPTAPEIAYEGDRTSAGTFVAFIEMDGVRAELSVTITPKQLDLSNVTIHWEGKEDAKSEYVYTGSAIEPAVTVMDGDLTLTLGVDYTVEYSGNVNAGELNEAMIIITFIGNYSDGVNEYFTIAKAPAEWTEPVKNDLLYYNGEAQAFGEAGYSEHGTVLYRLGEDGEWTEEVPMLTEAGEYWIWYKLVGDQNHVGSNEYSLLVTVMKAIPSVQAPQPYEGLIYSGVEQTLISEAVTDFGTVEYSLDGENWSVDIPTAKDAGLYVVYYRVVGNANVEDVAEGIVAAEITRAQLTISADSLTVEQYSAALPVSTYSVDGLQAGDVLITAPTIDRDVDLTTVGTYTVYIDGADAGNNYEITYKDGEIEVFAHTAHDPDEAGKCTFGICPMQYAAIIGEEYYEDLASALTAAGEAATEQVPVTVVMLTDYQNPDNLLTVPAHVILECGEFYAAIGENNGTLKGGQFVNNITNNGILEGGTYGVLITNYGTIKSGMFVDTVNNYGTIEDGTFEDAVDNYEDGVIKNGTYQYPVINYGTIENGTFTWSVMHRGGEIKGGSYVLSDALISEEGSLISGGTFESYVSLYGDVTGGTFTSNEQMLLCGTVTGGTFNGSVLINGTVEGITFEGEVRIDNNGTVENCTFENVVSNSGTIENCTFNSTSTVTNGGEIKNSTFEGDVVNQVTISGGTFKGAVENNGEITGGTFEGDVVNENSISGGTFNGAVTNQYAITGGTFNGDVTNQNILSGGTFNGAVTNDADAVIEGGTFESTLTNNGTIQNSNGLIHLGADFALEGEGTAACGDHHLSLETEPDCTTLCVLCGQLGVADHDYELFVSDPTCEQPGYTTKVCSVCDDGYLVEEFEALGHDYEAEVTAPTCIDDGYTTYTCSACGDSYTDDETEALGHDYVAEVIDPTCTEEGYTAYTCSVCEDSYEDDYVDALGHDYVAEVTDPTCTEDGYTTYTCSVCDASYEDDYVDALGHEYESVTTEPTCEEDGYTTYTCTACDDSYTDDVTVAVGHTYQCETVQATCTEAGLKTFTCSVCKYSYTEEIEARGHDYQSVVTQPTCTEAGYTVNTCTVCGHSYEDEEVEALGHTEVIDEAVTPTCTTAGKTEGKHCSVCNTVLVAQTEIPAPGHSYGDDGVCDVCGREQDTTCEHAETVTVPGYAATCTTQGLTEGVKCEACDEMLSVQVVIPALGHSYGEGVITTQPTCTEKGVKTFTCTACNDSYTEEVAALGHTEVVDAAVAPTCTEKGKSEGKHCSVCEEILVAQTEIDALGHSYGEGVVTTQPTCTEKGVKTFTCAACNDSYTEEVAALGHTEVVDAAVAPTCTEKGKSEGKHCSVCEEILVAQTEIDALGHSYGEGVITTQPTCTEQGVKTFTCTACDNSYTEEVEALGHTEVIDAAVVVSCTTAGKTEGKHCSVCNTVLVAQTEIPAPGHSYGDDGICDVCGREQDTTCEHAETVTVPGYAATCTTQGLTEGVKCEACDEMLSVQVVIPALGHSFGEGVITTQPTCTEKGVKTFTCAACEDSYTEEVEALGHTEVVDAAVAPTCTEKGKSEGKHCSVCEEILVAQTEIDALGHTEVVDAAVAPTCTEKGKSEGKHCSVCEEILVAQTEIDALGHSFGDWVTTKQPTATEDGCREKTCSACGEKITETIPATGEETTTPEQESTTPEEVTTPEQESTTPEEVTTPEEETTTPEEETTTPEEETTAPEEVTTPEESVTPEDTTAPEEVTVPEQTAPEQTEPEQTESKEETGCKAAERSVAVLLMMAMLSVAIVLGKKKIF